MCQISISMILWDPESVKYTLSGMEKCVILHFPGCPDAHRLSKNLTFSLAKQHFLAKSGNLGNRDLVVRVGTGMMNLDIRSEPLLFKANIAFP